MIFTPICNFLEKYTAENRLRLHTPGHNGEFPHDITEVFGADSLYDSHGSGIISESEAIAARLFSAKRTLYSCGGSTLAIQTGLALLKAKGCKTVAASRYSHSSFASACAALRLNIKWLYPEEFMSADIKYNKSAFHGADSVFINNVDYFGGTWKRTELPDIPILVDNAHGSYLRFVDKKKYGKEYLHPLEFGIPLMSAESAHKTLPVLTGGAYLHFTDGVDYQRAKEFMSYFGSSSPSYLMLESLDRFNGIMNENPHIVNNACDAVKYLKKKLELIGVPLKKSDPLRVVIKTREYGYTGTHYAAILRQNGIECEMADENYVVLMFSATSTLNDCERAAMAIRFITKREPLPQMKLPHIKPSVAMPMWKAMYKPSKLVPIDKAHGEICAEMKSICPPGVPLIFPGEIIDAATAEILKQRGVHKIHIISNG